MFFPHFSITPVITKALMEIEACRQAIADLPLTATMLDALRETARLLTTHYSTQIEGNRLTQSQVQAVLRGGGRFPGRERDEREVKHYYLALAEVEQLGQQEGPLSEKQIQRIHGLVMEGRRRPTRYRAGQNVIRDGSTGRIIYMPPDAADVPALMAELVQWINQETDKQELPIPIIAALAHYQFATIHPSYDGNGRTARLLTTLILHRYSYGLRGIYSLEEYYAQNLQGYYDALTVGSSHNYYEGRVGADVTSFVAYFCTGMAAAFAKVRTQADRMQVQGALNQSAILRELSAPQRNALSLFRHSQRISAKELATFFAISPRTASDLCVQWVQEGFLVLANPSKKARSYQLAPRYEALIAHSGEE
jgi:Fic family protein